MGSESRDRERRALADRLVPRGGSAVQSGLPPRGADAAKRGAWGRPAAAHARAGGQPCLAKRLDTVVKDETIW